MKLCGGCYSTRDDVLPSTAIYSGVNWMSVGICKECGSTVWEKSKGKSSTDIVRDIAGPLSAIPINTFYFQSQLADIQRQQMRSLEGKHSLGGYW